MSFRTSPWKMYVFETFIFGFLSFKYRSLRICKNRFCLILSHPFQIWIANLNFSYSQILDFSNFTLPLWQTSRTVTHPRMHTRKQTCFFCMFKFQVVLGNVKFSSIIFGGLYNWYETSCTSMMWTTLDILMIPNFLSKLLYQATKWRDNYESKKNKLRS